MRFDIDQHHKESDTRKELKHNILDLRRCRRIAQHLVGKFQKSKEFGRSYSNSVRNDLVNCLLYTSPSPRDLSTSRMPSSA